MEKRICNPPVALADGMAQAEGGLQIRQLKSSGLQIPNSNTTRFVINPLS
jgi:hypothetical protein